MRPAYNPPAPGYQHPTYVYVVRMCRGETVERSRPLTGSEVDTYIGFRHRGGWTYLDVEQRPA